MKKKFTYLLIVISTAMLIGACTDMGPFSLGILSHAGKSIVIANSWTIEKTAKLETKLDQNGEAIYLIENWRDLEFLSENIGKEGAPANGRYRLENDIVFPDRTGIPDDHQQEEYAQTSGFSPIGTPEMPFSGIFDGDGHTISNLVINRPNEDNIGLFGAVGAVGAAEEKRVRLENVHLENVTIMGNFNVGGFAGYVDNIIIKNSHVSGNISSPNRNLNENTIGNTGGFVGAGISVDIENSYGSGTVSGSNTNTGGFIGFGNAINIENSYVSGTVSGSNPHTGGFVGFGNAINIENSYVSGTVSGSNPHTGGFVGAGISVDIENSYVSGTVLGSDTNTGGFVGFGDAVDIENSYVSGTVSGSNTSTGVLLGSGVQTPQFTSVYYKRQTLNNENLSAVGTITGEIENQNLEGINPLAENEHTQDIFAGFDFTVSEETPDWAWEDGSSWPILFWEAERAAE